MVHLFHGGGGGRGYPRLRMPVLMPRHMRPPGNFIPPFGLPRSNMRPPMRPGALPPHRPGVMPPPRPGVMPPPRPGVMPPPRQGVMPPPPRLAVMPNPRPGAMPLTRPTGVIPHPRPGAIPPPRPGAIPPPRPGAMPLLRMLPPQHAPRPRLPPTPLRPHHLPIGDMPYPPIFPPRIRCLGIPPRGPSGLNLRRPIRPQQSVRGRGRFIRRGATVKRLVSANGQPKKNQKRRIKTEEMEINKPWVTEALKTEIQKKYQLCTIAKEKKTDSDWLAYKNQRIRVGLITSTAKLEYIGSHPEADVDEIMFGTIPKKALK